MLGGITKWCKTFWIKTFVYMGIGNVCHYYDVLGFLDENFHLIRKNADVSKMFGTNYQIEIIFTSEILQGQVHYAAPFSIRLAWKSFFSYLDHLYLCLFWLRACNSHILWRPPYSLPLPPFSNFVHPLSPTPCYFGWMRNYARSDLICYFAWWYYGPKLVKPWYLSTSSTLQCVLCRNTFC